MFFVVQAMESWVGPGNEASLEPRPPPKRKGGLVNIVHPYTMGLAVGVNWVSFEVAHWASVNWRVC